VAATELGDLQHVDDGLQLARLIGRALRRGLAHAQALVGAGGQLGAGQLAVGGQADGQRVGRLVGPRVVVAQVLVDGAQVQPEVVGGGPGHHAAGQQHAVPGLGVHLGRARGHHAAPRLPVQQRAPRLGHVVDEDAAHALGVFGRRGDGKAALAEHRPGPGMALLHGDGPALDVFVGAGGSALAQRRAAVRVHHQHAAPLGRHHDQVVRLAESCPRRQRAPAGTPVPPRFGAGRWGVGHFAPANRAAEMALARLAGVAGLVPSVDWLLYSAIRKEALLTSQIEGTQATLVDLFNNEAGQTLANPDDVEEVTNYLRAFHHVQSQLRSPDGLPLSVRLLCQAHRLLMDGVRGAGRQPGELRQSQNWIGGTRPGNAVFVPPPPQQVPRFAGRSGALHPPTAGRCRQQRKHTAPAGTHCAGACAV
jgi:hypothetical protein